MPVFAACSNPAGSAGTLMWNTTYSVVQVCNGTNWVGLGGNGNDGSGEVDPQVGALTDGKWCTASGGVVTCASDAPLANVALDDLTDATITSAASGNVLHYNGSAWVNTPIASLVSSSSAIGDRIVSGTTEMLVNEATNYVSLSTGGSTWGYFGSAASYLPQLSTVRISTTNISATTAHIAGLLGVGTNAPSTTMDVSGTARFRTAAADNDCTVDQDGALRYNSTTGRLQLCRPE